MTEAEWVKAVVGFFTTSLGVLLGLLGNSYVHWLRERRVYQSMLRAIASEGVSNKVVLIESFLKYYNKGIVLRQFSVITVVRCLNDPLFAKYAQPRHLNAVYDYLRNISLANAYREKCEGLQLGGKDENAQEWMGGMLRVWKKNLEECGRSIERIAAIADGQKYGTPQPDEPPRSVG